MTFKRNDFYAVMAKVQDLVPGLKQAFAVFKQRVGLDQRSKSLCINNGRKLAQLALELGRMPHEHSVDEISAYLYRMVAQEGLSASYFKQNVFGLRFWFRTLDREDFAITVCGYPKVAISKHKTVNTPQKLMRGRISINHCTRFFAKRLLAVVVSLLLCRKTIFFNAVFYPVFDVFCYVKSCCSSSSRSSFICLFV